MPDDGMMPGSDSPTSEDRSPNVTRVIVDKSFPADFRWVRRAVQTAVSGLDADGVPSAALGSVEIVLAEALNNVAEHAYPEGVEGNIRLIIRRRGNSLMVEIRDKGRPMPLGRAPDGTHPMSDEGGRQVAPEGGFGWFLIRELVSDLVYDRHDDENFLVFRMSIKALAESQSEGDAPA